MILKKMRKVIALIICAFLILISVTSSMAFAGNSGNRGDGSDPPISVNTYNKVYQRLSWYLLPGDTDFVVVKQAHKYCYVWTKTKLSVANQERIKTEIQEKDDQTIVPEGHFKFHFGYGKDFKLLQDTNSKYFIVWESSPGLQLSILNHCHYLDGTGINCIAYGTFGTPPAKVAKAQIHLFKKLNGKEPGKYKFQFKLKQVDEKWEDIENPYTREVQNDENGDIRFEDIFYDVSGDYCGYDDDDDDDDYCEHDDDDYCEHDDDDDCDDDDDDDKDDNCDYDNCDSSRSKVYYYVVTESGIDGDGMTYDKTVEHIKVSLTKNKHTNTWDTKIVYNDDRTFHNTYTKPEESTGTANIALKKVLEGMELTAEMFDFELLETDNQGKISEGGYGDTSTNSPKGAINFSPITYTTKDAGKTFYYRVTEKESKGLENIVYDNTPKTVEVKVADKATNGIYKVEVNYQNGDTFKNKYVEPKVLVKLDLTKKLTGLGLGDNMFQFNLVEVDQEFKEVPDGVKLEGHNDLSGKIIFPEIVYNKDYAGKEIIYKVTEDTSKNIAGMIYDNEAKYVTILVDKNATNGVYGITQHCPVDTVFNNVYEEPVLPVDPTGTANITLKKVLEGMELTAEMFDFELVETDNQGKISEGGYGDTSTNSPKGAINFSPITYTTKDAGKTFYYRVTEKESKGLENIIYDNTPKKVKVEVAPEATNGIYKVEVNYRNGDTFKNKYVEPKVLVKLDLTKKLTGLGLGDNMFQFNLVEVDQEFKEVPDGVKLEGHNDLSGKIIFPEIIYNKDYAGKEIIYKVTEDTSKKIAGMIYDNEAKYVTILVDKNATNGVYGITQHCPVDTVFNNVYEKPVLPEESTGTANITLTKILKNKTLQADMFTFELVQVDNAVNLGELGEKEFAKNDIDGNVNFKPINYNKEDAGKTFLYKITEDATKPISNITYDKEYRLVEVKVANEPVNGVYETKISFVKDDQIITNVYEKPVLPVDPTGTIKITKDIKILRGSKTINQDFYVTLFQDEKFETKFKVNPTQKLSIVNSQSTAVSYANLPKGIYYIAETDKDGNVITKENIGAQSIAYSTQKVEIKENHLSDSVTITNSFVGDSPIIIPQYGSITVVKDLLKDGKPFATDKVFYTALFSEKELKNRVSEIKAIEMKNQSTAKVTFTYAKSGSLINIGETYYVAETDKLGNPITDPKSIGIDQIKVDNNIANISYSSLDPQIRITNIIVTAQPVDPSEPEQPTDPTDPVEPTDPTDTIDNDNIVQTSDNNPIVMWGMTFVVALLALLGVNLRKLKKNIH